VRQASAQRDAPARSPPPSGGDRARARGGPASPGGGGGPHRGDERGAVEDDARRRAGDEARGFGTLLALFPRNKKEKRKKTTFSSHVASRETHGDETPIGRPAHASQPQWDRTPPYRLEEGTLAYFAKKNIRRARVQRRSSPKLLPRRLAAAAPSSLRTPFCNTSPTPCPFIDPSPAAAKYAWWRTVPMATMPSALRRRRDP